MKLIPVCSGKGGTGKSCVSAYTAAALASQRKKTLLIDSSGAPGSLDVILGAQDTAVYNLRDVLNGVCEPAKAIVPVPKHDNLHLLPDGFSSHSPDGDMDFLALLRTIKNDYDFVVVDNADFGMLDMKFASVVLLVTTPDTLSVRAASQKCRELYDEGAKNVRLVINNVPPRVIPMRSFTDFDEIIDQTCAQLIAVIPASQRLHYSANNGVSLPQDSLTLQVFDRLAKRIRGKHEPLLIR